MIIDEEQSHSGPEGKLFPSDNETAETLFFNNEEHDIERPENVLKKLFDVIEMISSFVKQSNGNLTTKSKLIETQEKILGLKSVDTNEDKLKDKGQEVLKENKLFDYLDEELFREILNGSKDEEILFMKDKKDKTDDERLLGLLSKELTREAIDRDIVESKIEDKTNFDAIDLALASLLEPNETKKISPTFLKTIIELDTFLSEEETMERRAEEKVNMLLKEAVQLASGVVKLREKVEKRLLNSKAKAVK